MKITENAALREQLCYAALMKKGFTFIKVALGLGILFAGGLAQAQASSPYDAYYRQQAAGRNPTGRPPAPIIDNDQYYTAPGQYFDNRAYGPTGQYLPQNVPSRGCSSISDSPECLGD